MWRKILLMLSILMICLVVAMLLLPRLLDLDPYRQQIIADVQDITGRALIIDGDLHANLSLQPSFTLSGIKFANIAGSADPHMLSVDKLQLQIRLLPLLYGQIHIDQIVATDVKLLLETNARGRNNWDLQIKHEEIPQLPQVGLLELNNLTLLRRDATNGQSQQIKLRHLQIKDINQLTSMRLALDGRYQQQQLHATAHVSLSEKLDSIRIEQLEATVGKSDLAGNIDLRWDRERSHLKAEFSSREFSLASPEKADKEEVKQQDKIFSPNPLPLALLSNVDGEIHYRAEKITGITFAITNLTTKALLKRGHIVMAPIKFQVADSSSSINLDIDLRSALPKVHATIEAAGLDLGTIFMSPSGKPQYTGEGELQADLHGEGASVASLMASLNGHSSLLVGPGELNVSLDGVTGGPQHLLGTLILPGSSSSQVNCMASEVEFKDGIATSRAFLLDAKHSTLFGDGTVNLGSERLNLLFRPKPKTTTLNVAIPVKVSGTLAHPTYTLEKSGSLRKAVGVAGLFVFPPAALLGLAEMGTGEQNPCLRIAAGEDISTAPPKSSIERGTDAIKGGLESVGGKIKGLFGN